MCISVLSGFVQFRVWVELFRTVLGAVTGGMTLSYFSRELLVVGWVASSCLVGGGTDRLRLFSFPVCHVAWRGVVSAYSRTGGPLDSFAIIGAFLEVCVCVLRWIQPNRLSAGVFPFWPFFDAVRHLLREKLA